MHILIIDKKIDLSQKEINHHSNFVFFVFFILGLKSDTTHRIMGNVIIEFTSVSLHDLSLARYSEVKMARIFFFIFKYQAKRNTCSLITKIIETKHKK